MQHLVRHLQSNSAVAETGTELPPREHQSGPIIAISQISIGIEPRLSFSWQISSWAWRSRFKLLVFRSTTGFCPEPYPDDLKKHGQLFIETIHDGSHEEVPHEGTHFFSLVLYKRGWFGLWATVSILRFSETVPSAKVGIARIKDQAELHDMVQRDEIGGIEFDAKLNEAKIRTIRSQRSLQELENPAPQKTPKDSEPMNAEEMQDVDAMIEAMFAKRKKLAELRKDERFSDLSPEERDAAFEWIAERLDPAEYMARREMRRK